MHQMIKTSKKVDYEKFLAICSYDIGLSDKTTKKYLKDLETLNLVKVNEKDGWIIAVVEDVVKE